MGLTVEIKHGQSSIGAEAHSSALMRGPSDRNVLPKVQRSLEQVRVNVEVAADIM